MKMAFFAKYREGGLLLLRLSLGVLFLYLTAPALLGGHARWTHFGSDMHALGFRSHLAWWGFVGALAGSLGGVLMIFGLFFRIGILLALAVTVVHMIAIVSGRLGWHGAFPSVEMACILVSLLCIGPGKFSVDKT